MKLSHVGMLALVGMISTSLSVLAYTPEVGAVAESGLAEVAATVAQTTPPVVQSQIALGSTVKVAGRLSHAELAQGEPGKAYVLLELQGADAQQAVRPPVSMALVLDRSGSMAGERMKRAKEAARGVVQRLADGDVVTVLGFDTKTQLVLPPTTLSASNRAAVLASITNIALGGDTCISCGIEDAMKQLSGFSNMPQSMIVLSDGKANNGLRDADSLRKLARDCGDKGVPLTTVGVGLDYEEEKLTAISQASNGRHHFAETTASLPALFDAEAKAVAGTVATNVTVSLRVAEGVQAVKVFDRAHQNNGTSVAVELGALARGEVKTVLVELTVPTAELGSAPVVDVSLRYDDLVDRSSGNVSGALGVTIANASSDMDPRVEARLERSRTSTTLKKVNKLLRKGDITGADAALAKREAQLKEAKRKSSDPAKVKGPKGKPTSDGTGQGYGEANKDYDRQIGSTTRARDALKKKKKKKKKGGKRAKGICGCAPSDMACNMRCSQKGNAKDAYDYGY